MFEIRKSEKKDLNFVLELIASGRKKMIESGNTKQWSNGQPTTKQIENDI